MATQTEIQQALQQPYDQKRFAAEVLKPVFGSTFSYAHAPSKPTILPTASEQAVIHEVLIYGSVSLEDGTEITCYQILLQPTVRIEQSRVAIQQYVRKLITAGDAALINFISPNSKDNWRFTLVASDTQLGDEGIEEVKTNPKRYTYLIEKERHNRTMADRMSALSLDSDITLQSLIKAFSVEAMSKAFFNEYKEHYQNFVEYITGKRMVKVKGKWTEQETGQPHAYLKSLFNGNEKDARDFIKKLMGRIVFLYFVQKKRWLGASTTDYTDGPYDFIAKLFEETGGNKNFFPIGLSELFFNALNKERPNDDWKMPSGKTVKIPYLNGGLFERDDIDEKIHKKGDMLTFPPGLFSHVDKQDTPIERGFLDFLNAYNFTVYEDSEDDHTIAVDPEMLGHIFENLLEDNNDKGAFYTPKEIVHYMCRESLIEYLSTHLEKEYKVYRQLGKNQVELFGNEVKTGQLSMMEELGDKALDRSEVEHMVKEKDIRNLTGAQLNRIDELLDEVKICDPAIGSGAFPMGLLQEIFTIKEAIALKQQKPFEAADVKEHIISNSIYGVDIERGAVDIARLRFWLSLVVDENQPKALPNLDYKIVVGDSLLSKFNGEIVEIDWERKKTTTSTKSIVASIQKGLKEITQRQQQFFDPTIANKSNLKLDIRNLKLDVLINQVSLNKLEYADNTPEKGGFAPTAIEQIHNTERKVKISGYNKTLKNLKILKENPIRPFQHFDWKLDFPEVMNELVAVEKTGFDIVIGNPPYINFRNLSDQVLKRQLLDKFLASEYQTDFYILFLEQCVKSLSISGTYSLIVPNSLTNNLNNSKIRKFILETSDIKSLANTPIGVFEEATVDTVIICASRNRSINGRSTIRTYDLIDHSFKPLQLRSQQDFLASESYSFDFLTSNRNRTLIAKIQQGTIQLKSLTESTSGIKEYETGKGSPPQTVRDREQKVYNSDYKVDSKHRRHLSGNEIEPYQLNWKGGYIKYGKNLAAPRDQKFFKGSRFIIREIPGNGRLIAAFTSENFTVKNTAHVFSSTNSLVPDLFLCALVNSKLFGFYFTNKFSERDKVFPKAKIGQCRLLPILVPNRKSNKLIIESASQILTLKKQGKDTTALEREIDLLVYKLYDLTWKEACVIEENKEWMSKGEYEKFKLPE